MKFTILTILSLALILVSCGSKKNSGSSLSLPENPVIQNEQPTITETPSPPEKLPISTFELVEQTEEFYVPRESTNLTIIVTPLLKKTEIRTKYVHFTDLFQKNSYREVPFKFGTCKVEEYRITDYKISQATESMSFNQLSLDIDHSTYKFTHNKNFSYNGKDSVFKVNLPETRGDYFIKLSSQNFTTPILGIFNKEECDRKIAENPSRFINEQSPINLTPRGADQSTWTSYKVEIYDETPKD